VSVVGTPEPPGRACTNGGVKYTAANGISYVCNGAPGAPATRAAAPCFDNTNRYVDCGNGTVTDTVTGLIWLKQANCLPNTWSLANQAAAGLKDGACGLTDKSAAGDWRLPTKDEWSATIARAVALGCKLGGPGTYPSLTNDPGTACLSVGPSAFAGVALGYYWSSTTIETFPSNAWSADLVNGNVSNSSKDFSLLVWPVRGGSR
jgi:hypothetical protein